MPKRSAGIVLYRRAGGSVELLLVHPGGPLWARKDARAWSIPKGEIEEHEEPLGAALREFSEETGAAPPPGTALALPPLRQPSGKWVLPFAIEGDCDPATLRSNEFELEWPPRSGRRTRHPEVDRAAWFTPSEARDKLHAGQVRIVDELLKLLAAG